MKKLKERDPVENAVMAVACLSNDDRRKAVDRFNALFARCPTVSDLIYADKPLTHHAPHATTAADHRRV